MVAKIYNIRAKIDVEKDKSLLGTMHMLSHHALMLRQKAKHESSLADTANKIYELAYSGMALVDYHPNMEFDHPKADTLGNKLRAIKKLIPLLEESEISDQQIDDIPKIKLFFTSAYKQALGEH